MLLYTFDITFLISFRVRFLRFSIKKEEKIDTVDQPQNQNSFICY